MSIKKSICALFIALALMLGIAVLPASAVTEEINVNSIYNYAWSIQYQISCVGERKPYSDDFYKRSYSLADEVMNKCSDYESGEITAIELQNKYDELQEFYNNPWIDPNLAESTCYIAIHDQNYNNWYNDEQWNDFVEKRDRLLQALRVNHPDLEPDVWGSVWFYEYTISQQKYISKCFYDLLYIYNVMTCKDIILGDVNGDGSVDVQDATNMQKHIAGQIEFTAGQRLRGKVTWDRSFGDDVNIKDVTILQKHIIDPTSEDAWLYGGGIVEDEKDFATSLDNWEICDMW